jgi:hypothetical protein
MSRRHEPELDQDQLLDAVPTHNRAVRSEQRGRALILWVPIRRRWWMQGLLGFLLPFRREKGIALDALGQEVWRACDGEQRLETIIETFAARHQIRFHEARSSVMQFLRSLVERRLVALVVPGGPASDAGKDGPG